MKRLAAISLALMLAAAGRAEAASSAWQHFEGAALRVVVSGVPEADGSLRAALEIALKPGWKTYWLDPGDSGVPPSIEAVVDGQAVETSIAMPPPRRLSDGYSTFAGYDRSLAIAVTLDSTGGLPAGADLAFAAFIGVCETICVPIRAEFAVAAGLADGDDAAAVDAAFAALPSEAGADFGIVSAWTSGDELLVDVALPDGSSDAELFVASAEGFILGEPRRDGAAARFRVPLLDRPTDPTKVEKTRYTLVSEGGAVSGELAIAGHP